MEVCVRVCCAYQVFIVLDALKTVEVLDRQGVGQQRAQACGGGACRMHRHTKCACLLVQRILQLLHALVATGAVPRQRCWIGRLQLLPVFPGVVFVGRWESTHVAPESAPVARQSCAVGWSTADQDQSAAMPPVFWCTPTHAREECQQSLHNDTCDDIHVWQCKNAHVG